LKDLDKEGEMARKFRTHVTVQQLYRMTAKPESGRKLGAPTGEQDNNIKININHLKPSVYFMYQQVLHSAFSVHLCILYGSIFCFVWV